MDAPANSYVRIEYRPTAPSVRECPGCGKTFHSTHGLMPIVFVFTALPRSQSGYAYTIDAFVCCSDECAAITLSEQALLLSDT